MIIQIIILGIVCGYAAKLLYNKMRVPQVVDAPVNVWPRRKKGEVLLIPWKSSLKADDHMAVVVIDELEDDYYRVRTLHEPPHIFSVHASSLHLRTDIFGNENILTDCGKITKTERYISPQ